LEKEGKWRTSLCVFHNCTAAMGDKIPLNIICDAL